jgi:hypothetical protein
MRHWEDKGKRRVWRWVLLVYSLAAFVMSVIGAFTFRSDIILAAIFLTSAFVLIIEWRLGNDVVWIVAILLSLPTLPYGLIYGCSSFEIVAGRNRNEGRILGAPFISVSDGFLTPYYRKYVPESLPKPEWLPAYKGQIGLLGFFEPHTDYLMGSPGNGMGITLQSYQAPEQVQDAVIKNYFALSTVPRPVGDDTNLYLVKKYTRDLYAVYLKKDGNVSVADLPDPKKIMEEGMKELEKLKEKQ